MPAGSAVYQCFQRRLLVLENRLGLIETAEGRRVLALVEEIRRRRAARLAREGIEYKPPEWTREELSGLSVAEILRRGRDRDRRGRSASLTRGNSRRTGEASDPETP